MSHPFASTSTAFVSGVISALVTVVELFRRSGSGGDKRAEKKGIPFNIGYLIKQLLFSWIATGVLLICFSVHSTWQEHVDLHHPHKKFILSQCIDSVFAEVLAFIKMVSGIAPFVRYFITNVSLQDEYLHNSK